MEGDAPEPEGVTAQSLEELMDGMEEGELPPTPPDGAGDGVDAWLLQDLETAGTIATKPAPEKEDVGAVMRDAVETEFTRAGAKANEAEGGEGDEDGETAQCANEAAEKQPSKRVSRRKEKDSPRRKARGEAQIRKVLNKVSRVVHPQWQQPEWHLAQGGVLETAGLTIMCVREGHEALVCGQ